MSKRPAPVAIISIAQQARPKVIGQSADLRAQLMPNWATFESTTGATTFRRIEFMIESTVVKTNPSSCSAITERVQRLESNVQSLRIRSDIGLWTNLSPFQRAFTPRVIITNDQDSNEDKHFHQRKLREREIVAHENNRPRQ